MQTETERQGMRAIRYDSSATVPYFIDVLRRRRVELGMSQKALADELGWQERRISDYEHGNKPIHPRLLVRWAAALDMEITALPIPNGNELLGG